MSENAFITPDRHGPARIENYLTAHENHMDQMRSKGFVGGDTLQFDFLTGENLLIISGKIACLGPIVVTVVKYLHVLEREGRSDYVQTFEYHYNFSVENTGNILRYDNDHKYPGHPDEHHKHHYDYRTGKQTRWPPEWKGQDNWPTLGDAMQEIERWYYENLDNLPDPDSFPDLSVQR